MLSRNEFIQQSIDLHIFFGRIMKEHSFFLQLSFTPKDANYTQQANNFRMDFERFLGEVVSLANGVVSSSVLKSGEAITPFTLRAEMATSYLTGIPIATNITQAEARLTNNNSMINNPMLEERVFALNNRAMTLVRSLIQFKMNILTQVSSCKMVTNNYPTMIHHILEEAQFYFRMIQSLQNRENINVDEEAFKEETFWNDIMHEHSEFIRGLLDPTEEKLIKKANNFADEFDRLEKEAKAAKNRVAVLKKVTADSLKATTQLAEFKTQGVQGILDCKVKALILPLLADHVLREANHYLRLLNMFSKELKPGK